MKTGGWKDWFEMAGLAAILVSLVFLGYQLRQDQLIARSELASASFEMQIDINQQLLDPDFAKTYVAMLERPEELSLQQKLQIDALFHSVVRLFVRECFMLARDIFVECHGIIRNNVRRYFGNPYGQAWWRDNRYYYPQAPLPEWLDEEIENMDPNTTREALERFGKPR